MTEVPLPFIDVGPYYDHDDNGPVLLNMNLVTKIEFGVEDGYIFNADVKFSGDVALLSQQQTKKLLAALGMKEKMPWPKDV